MDRHREEVVKTASDVLRDVRELLADENRWCRYRPAIDADFRMVNPADPRASRFCLSGAIRRCSSGDVDVDDSVRVLLSNATRELFGIPSYIDVNDENGHDAVMAILDRGIELAAKEARAAVEEHDEVIDEAYDSND